MLSTASLAFFFAASAIAATGIAAVIEGPVVNPANNHRYYLLDSGGGWDAAEAEAVGLGGHLVTINDAAENAWIVNTFLTGYTSSGDRMLYIGLNDRGQEGQFQWVDGSPVTYTNFAGADGNRPEWDQARMLSFAPYTGQWVFPPTGPTNGLVEVVPEPTSIAAAAVALGVLSRRRITRS